MQAAIALGSNLPSSFGPPAANLHEALRRLAALGTVTSVSTFRNTTPVGLLDQPDFLNAAALLETPLSPEPLLEALLTIEHAMGRDRASVPPKGPRIIDLDLLFMLDGATHLLRATPTLTLPHPALPLRPFVLEPLAEIAPAWLHPHLHQTPSQLLQKPPT